MKLSHAIKLGQSRAEFVYDAKTGHRGYVMRSTVNGETVIKLDTLAAAHLGAVRVLTAFVDFAPEDAEIVTRELMAEFPHLGQRVRYFPRPLAGLLRDAGLPFKSQDWSLFKVITELDARGYSDTAGLLERARL